MSYKRLSKDNTAVLFVDHQAGLFSLVQDFTPDVFHSSVMALVDIAVYFKLPTVLTTSFEQGPNGPMIPEIRAKLPNAPFIARPGQINAWDNEDFVAAVKKTGRKQLIIAGIATDVCVAFPALSAIEEGYDIFVATDASGTLSEANRYATWSRLQHGGAQLMTWFSIASELQRDWRNDVEGFGKLMSSHLPSYRYLMDSYNTKK